MTSRKEVASMSERGRRTSTDSDGSGTEQFKQPLKGGDSTMKQQTTKKAIAATLALSIATMPALSWSGWVDDWMTQKTSTSPSYYEGAKRGYYTGGSFSARWPNGTDYPVTVTM